MDARGRNNGVLIPLSLRPEVISVHSQPVAARVEVRDPQLSFVHSVVNLIKECVDFGFTLMKVFSKERFLC